MNTDMEVKINMAAQMSNDELREAIKYAHERVYDLAPSGSLHPVWIKHLSALLEIQRGRAAACSVDNSNPSHHAEPSLGGDSVDGVVLRPNALQP